MTGPAPVLHQASCVAIGTAGKRRGLLIEGPPGSGKSSLTLALIDRGAQLVGDDGVQMSVAADGRLIAAPPPHISGLLEIRNVGIVQLPVVTTPVSLVILLDPSAPRYIETAERVERLGCPIPLIRLWPDSPVLHLRAEQALCLHGIAGQD